MRDQRCKGLPELILCLASLLSSPGTTSYMLTSTHIQTHTYTLYRQQTLLRSESSSLLKGNSVLIVTPALLFSG